MTPLAFIRSAEARRALERAARAAAAPAAVHFVERGEEGPRIVSTGGCAACRYVQGLPGGAASCRASRLEAAAKALRHGNATPFLCHMGFACVATPALPGSDTGFVLTFGPYCPAEAVELLEDDARRGIERLGAEGPDNLATLLADIRPACSDAVPVVAEWAADTLAEGYRRADDPQAESADKDPGGAPSATRRRRGRVSPDAGPYGAADIAAALAGGEQARARTLILGALSESPAGSGARIAARRARITAVVAAVLDAAETARLATGDAWERMPAFLEELRGARTDAQLATAATGVLRTIRRTSKRAEEGDAGLTALNRILTERLADKVTLGVVAKELGVHPTAVTHRLQRRFGMSFSEYLGRLRVDKAKELLRRTRLGIGQVALRVGINDVSNFGKLFRKFEGCSPQDYRDRYGGKR